MKDYKTMTVTELDKLYWEVYDKMYRLRDHKSYKDYCEIGGAIMQEYGRRDLVTMSDVAKAVADERKFNA